MPKTNIIKPKPGKYGSNSSSVKSLHLFLEMIIEAVSKISGCAKLPSPNFPSPNICSKANLALELLEGENENLKSRFLPGKCILHLRFSVEQLEAR